MNVIIILLMLVQLTYAAPFERWQNRMIVKCEKQGRVSPEKCIEERLYGLSYEPKHRDSNLFSYKDKICKRGSNSNILKLYGAKACRNFIYGGGALHFTYDLIKECDGFNKTQDSLINCLTKVIESKKSIPLQHCNGIIDLGSKFLKTANKCLSKLDKSKNSVCLIDLKNGINLYKKCFIKRLQSDKKRYDGIVAVPKKRTYKSCSRHDDGIWCRNGGPRAIKVQDFKKDKISGGNSMREK